MNLKHKGAAALWLILGAALSAQTPAQPPAQKPSAPQEKAAQEKVATADKQPTFRVQIDAVTQDVIVRDDKGQFVPDLTKDDFEIYEDGVKQDISSMYLIHGGRVSNLVAPPPPAAPEGIVLPAPRQVSDVSGRIFLFFVDDLHMDFRNTGRIRELFKKISKNLLHDGDMWGMVSSGPSSIAIDMTYDRNRFEEAIKKITGNGLKPTDIINGPESSEGPSEVRYRAHVAFSTVNDVLQNLEKVHNRRKAVVYVSDGYDFNPFSDARLGEDPNGVFAGRFGQNANDTKNDPVEQQMRQGQQFADADLARELGELTRAANRANATFYTIDPRGLVGGPDLDENINPTEWGDYIRKSQDSLRVLAEETGGLAVVNQNDFDKALKRVDAETSDYYVLGYYSKNPDPTKRRRQVEVKVNRKNVSVYSRKEYSLKPVPVTSTKRP